MTRKFKVTETTGIKLLDPKPLSEMKAIDFAILQKDSIIQVADEISEASYQSFLLNLECYIYKNHLQEIKPEVKTILPFEKGKQLFKGRYTDSIHLDLQKCLSRFNITTRNRIRHFLAQCGHESAGLRYRLEIASGKAYEGRRDLGNIYPGDGVKYKGGGFIQTTGRSNYTALSKYLNDSKVLSQGAIYVGRVYPWTSSGFWWYRNGINRLIDNGASVRQVSIRVNGGTNGLSDRYRWFEHTAII